MTAEKFRPKFTTSAKAQEERADERKQKGAYFGDRVKTTTKGYIGEEPSPGGSGEKASN